MTRHEWPTIYNQGNSQMTRLFKAAERVIEVARRFVPDPAIIQWEQREIDLREAIATYFKLKEQKGGKDV